MCNTITKPCEYERFTTPLLDSEIQTKSFLGRPFREKNSIHQSLSRRPGNPIRSESKRINRNADTVWVYRRRGIGKLFSETKHCTRICGAKIRIVEMYVLY